MLRQRYGTRVSSKQARAFCTRQKLLGQTALISARTRQQARRHCGSPDYGTLTLLLQGVGGEAHAVSVTCSEPLRWIGRRP